MSHFLDCRLILTNTFSIPKEVSAFKSLEGLSQNYVPLSPPLLPKMFPLLLCPFPSQVWTDPFPKPF